MRLLQIGNFEPPHSTENDLFRTMVETLGWQVHKLQEQDVRGWERATAALVNNDAQWDCVLWTRTKSLSEQVPVLTRRRLQIQAALVGVPTYGYHLDRWWGLARQEDVYDDPFFRCTRVFTADGHHQAYWMAADVRHEWLLPAIAPHNVGRGNFRAEFAADIAFVGNWHSYGHTEWSHRPQLVKWLRRHYARHVRFFPDAGAPAIRGEDLKDLYASVKVVVGDSCLVPGADGRPMTNYCSDRVFETIGRGALLIHPDVGGVTDGGGGLGLCGIRSAEHLLTWPLGEWDVLDLQIRRALDDAAGRGRIAAAGMEQVRKYGTYANRLRVVEAMARATPVESAL